MVILVVETPSLHGLLDHNCNTSQVLFLQSYPLAFLILLVLLEFHLLYRIIFPFSLLMHPGLYNTLYDDLLKHKIHNTHYLGHLNIFVRLGRSVKDDQFSYIIHSILLLSGYSVVV